MYNPNDAGRIKHIAILSLNGDECPPVLERMPRILTYDVSHSLRGSDLLSLAPKFI
jgi:hypothetical protein